MQHCLECAVRGRGLVGNGALVGAVLIRDGTILAEGFHAGFGMSHAERELLQKFEQKISSEDILYVNLEPCCHQGKTPPCTNIIIEKGIKRVVYGMQDPDPRVAGKGIATLREAGVDVRGPVLPAQCAWLNRGFLSVRTKGRPWITLKQAMDRSDAVSHPDGTPRAITSPEQNAWSHAHLRATHDAILVGVGTIVSDDPQLTVRHAAAAVQPWRLLLDPHVRIPPEARVLTDGHAARTMIVYCSKAGDIDAAKSAALTERGIRLLDIDMTGASGFALEQLWPLLLTPDGDYHGMTSILVEGGPRTWEFFRKAGVVDTEVTLIGR